MTTQRTKPAFPSAPLAAAIEERPATERAHRPGHLPLEALWVRQARGNDSQTVLAKRIGRRRWFVERVERGELSLAVRDLASAPATFALHVIGKLAAVHGAAVAPLPAVVDMPDAVRHSRIQCEAADVVRVVAEHAADGRHDVGELQTQERELMELLVETQNRLAWVREKLKGMR